MEQSPILVRLSPEEQHEFEEFVKQRKLKMEPRLAPKAEPDEPIPPPAVATPSVPVATPSVLVATSLTEAAPSAPSAPAALSAPASPTLSGTDRQQPSANRSDLAHLNQLAPAVEPALVAPTASVPLAQPTLAPTVEPFGQQLRCQLALAVGAADPQTPVKVPLNAAAPLASAVGAADLQTPVKVKQELGLERDAPPTTLMTLTAPGAKAAEAIAALKAGATLNELSGEKQSKAESQATHKRFERALQPATERQSRAAKCPESLALKIKQDKVTARGYFTLYVHCKEDWAEVVIVEKFIIEKIKSELSKRKWMTEHEIRERNSPLVADCIINTKKLDPHQWRPNPDCPDCPEGIEYLVSEYEGVSDELRSTELSESSLRSTLDPTSAAAILPQRLQTMTSAAASSSGVLPAPQAETSGGQGVQTSGGQEGNGQRPAGRELTAKQQQLAEKRRIEKERKEAKKFQDKQDAELFKTTAKGRAAAERRKCEREITQCQSFIAECASGLKDMPDKKKRNLKTILEGELDELEQLRTCLGDASATDAALEDAIERAGTTISSYREQEKMFKKVKYSIDQ